MSTLMRRDRRPDATMTPFGRMDRFLDEWFRAMPLGRPVGTGWDPNEQIIRVDEYRDGDATVVKAELPGVDPAKDVTITVQDGMLTIAAERRTEQDREVEGYHRHELRYGSMTRSLPLPEGVAEDDITASYSGGILEVRIPTPAEQEKPAPTTIPITTG